MALPARGINVEILDLRHFSSSDLRPLLDQEMEVWSRLLAWDYRGSAEMILRYIDSKILPGYAAVDHGRVSGYSFFVYEGNKGVIGDLFVSPDDGATAERNIQHKLLRHVIETLQQSPGIHRIEAQLLVHEAGQLAEPFLGEGFKRHPRLFMAHTLDDNRPPGPPVPVPAEIELRRWSEHDYHGVASVITESYRGHVDSEINDQYRSVSGSMRFLNNIVRFPGCGTFDPEASFIASHRATRATIGVVLCSRVKDNVGHVTQVCVLPEQRGKRIGEALLSAAANDLRRRNFSALTLTVTEANRGAVVLYKQMGYESRRIFDAFVWEG